VPYKEEPMAKNRSGRSAGSAPAPNDRRSNRPGGSAGRDSSRALARASTRGAGGNGAASLLLWTGLFVVIAVVVVATVLIVSGGKNSTATGDVTAPTVVTPASIPVTGRTLGNPNAAITVDIYGDFRCVACFGFTTGGTEQNLVQNYIAGGKVKLVWHDYLSIDKIQGNTASRDAANAAWCAADQGKFWVMHDWLYANDGSGSEDASVFTPTRISQIAKAAGLDMSTFQACADGGSHLADIAAEDAVTPAGVTGTPAILVNGKIVGSQGYVPTYAQIKAAIDAIG
jgi:protein-disulfide isomerase